MIKLQWHIGYIWGLVVLTLLLFKFATNIGMIVFLSILFALLLRPVKQRLERRLPASLAALFALLGFLAVAGFFFFWIIDNLAPGLKQLAANAPELLNRQAITQWLLSLQLPSELIDYVDRLMDNARAFVITAVKSSIIPALNALSSLVELVGIPFITFYLLKDAEHLQELAVSFAPQRERKRILDFYAAAGGVLGGYIKGQLAVCLFSGASVFLFFHFLGLPYAGVFAAISALGEFIPVFGPLTSSLFAIMFALTFSTTAAIKAALFYVIMFKLSNAVVYPNLIGKAVQLHPVVIMVGLLLFGSLFGVLGMMVAVPAMGLIRLILAHTLPKGE